MKDVKPVNWNSIQDSTDLLVWNKLTEQFWLPEKIALSNDRKSWDMLDSSMQDALMKVFAGLTNLDTIQGSVGAVSQLPFALTQHEEAVLLNIGFMEAFTAGTQLLTDSGWKNIEDITEDDLVAQYEPDTNTTSFTHPKIVPPHFSNEVYEIASKDGSLKQFVSGGHRVYVEEQAEINSQHHEWIPTVYEARHLKNIDVDSSFRRFRSAAPSAPGEGMTDIDRMLVCINARGTFSNKIHNGEKVDTIPVELSFAKQNGVDKFFTLAESIGWNVREITDTENSQQFYLDVPLCYVQDGQTKQLDKWWNLASQSSHWCQQFIKEVALWNGDISEADKEAIFRTTSEADSDFVVAAALLSGYHSYTTRQVGRSSGTYSDVLVTNITLSCDTISAESMTIKSVEPQMVYCVQVPSTFLVTRNGSSPVISGNCVHAKSYSSIFMTLSSTPQINKAMEWAENNELMVEKRKYLLDSYELDSPTRVRAISVLLESFLFYTGFFLPLYLSTKGKLTNTADIIRLILRDETVHGYYIGYKYQKECEKLPREQAEQEKQWVLSTLTKLYELEKEYTHLIYDDVGLSDEVIEFLKYNANKALANLGYEPMFEHVNPDPIIISSLSTNSENHDFFSGSGSSYTIGMAEEITDEDWDF